MPKWNETAPRLPIELGWKAALEYYARRLAVFLLCAIVLAALAFSFLVIWMMTTTPTP